MGFVRILSMLALLALSSCAGFGGCTVEKWAELPVRLYQNIPLVQVSINGRAVVLVLDTGAQRTLVTSGAALRLGLIQGQQRGMVMRGIGGSMVNWEAKPESFTFADIGVRPMTVMVAPITLPVVGGIQPDGLLGADVLSALDVDLDLPHGKVAFYRARTCPAGPPWSEPYATIAVHRSPRNALLLPVSLNGAPLQAELDSGTSVSTVTPTAAFKAGVPPEAMANDPVIAVRGANPGLSSQRVHRFTEVGIGQDRFPGPMFLVGGLQSGEWDMLLGADYLRRKRVWLSYATGRIFIAPPSGVIVRASP
jgi:predicted aspartyl protease